jgi:uncharacterized protein (TIGR02246 family)
MTPLIKEEMHALMDQWVRSFSSGDVEQCVAFYTEDGAIYSPYGLPAIGRDAIRRVHKEWLDAGETNKTIKVIEAHADGVLAYCVAAYAGDCPDDGGNPITESGTSLNIAKRELDGTWRLHISSLNSDTPSLHVSSESFSRSPATMNKGD